MFVTCPHCNEKNYFNSEEVKGLLEINTVADIHIQCVHCNEIFEVTITPSGW